MAPSAGAEELAGDSVTVTMPPATPETAAAILQQGGRMGAAAAESLVAALAREHPLLLLPGSLRVVSGCFCDVDVRTNPAAERQILKVGCGVCVSTEAGFERPAWVD